MARGFRRRNASQPPAEKEDTKTVFEPTATNVKLCFKRGDAKDAAGFEECKSALVNHVGLQAWLYATDISRAMRKLEQVDPEDWAPEKPTCYYNNADGSRTMNKRARGVPGGDKLEPEKEEWGWTIEIEEYGDAWRTYGKRVAAWTENKGKAYHIVTTHCPSEVKSEQRNQPRWAEIEDGNDVIALLLLLRDLS